MARGAAASLTITGVPRMRRALLRTQSTLQRRSTSALVAEARAILRSSRPEVPVESGDLRASGRVLPPEIEMQSVSVAIRYGEGLPGGYAVAIHEHPSVSSPPSWGGEVNFRRGGPKYLERPMNAAIAGMMDRIAARVVGGGSGGGA